MTGRRPRHKVFKTDDEQRILGRVPLSPTEEIRVTVHHFRRKPVYGVRKWRFVREEWSPTGNGLSVGEVTFLELVDLLVEVAGVIEEESPMSRSTKAEGILEKEKTEVGK